MARKKMPLQYITKNPVRRATFKKRRANLMKKVSELATLCDVDACVVVYGEGESHPEVFPPSATEATRILGRFQAMPDLERCKKMLDMEGFIRQRITKLKQQLEKARRDNQVRENTLLLHDVIAGRRLISGLSKEELNNLNSTVNTRLEEVKNAMQRHDEQGQSNPAMALQLPQASHEPPMPSTASTGNMEMQAPAKPNPHGWLFDDGEAGGLFGSESGSFGRDMFGASTSGGLDDMFKLGNAMAGLPWPDHEPSFPPPM